MATFHGKEGVVETDGNAVANIVEWTVTETGAVAPDTVMGAAAETHKIGIPAWVASITCRWDDTDTNGQVALTILASVTLALNPEGDSTGDFQYTGTATVTSRGASARFDDVVEQTFELTGNGALTLGTHS